METRLRVPNATATATAGHDADAGSRKESPPRELGVLVLTLLCYCFYAALFIYRTSFVIDGQRYFSLLDDAMISMRYARNLAHGYGLVWNPGGPRVEGYTNPLWTVFMSLFHLLPVDPSKISLFVQVSGALFLIINLLFVRKIAHRVSNGSSMVSWAAVFLTAFYLPLNNWGLQGSEVSVLALAISMAVWDAIRCLDGGHIPARLYVVLGVATLVRPDMVVPFLSVLAFLLIADPARRRRHLLVGVTSLAFFTLAQTGFRALYYGPFLPNTYYLKMTGYPVALRIARGFAVFLTFIWNMNWMLFLIPCWGLLVRRDRRVLLLMWVFLAQVAYSIYVGGDAWEWWGGSDRYISVAMPIWFISFCWALQQIALFAADKLPLGSLARPQYSRYAMVIFILFSFFNFNAIDGSPDLSKWFLIVRPLEVDLGIQKVEIARAIGRVTDSQATVGVFAAGAIPYFSDRNAIDFYGKTDAKIAREPMRRPSNPLQYNYFLPGHLKWDYAYTLGALKPDVIGEAVVHPDEARSYLQSEYEYAYEGSRGVYCLRGSTHVLWDKLRLSGGVR